MSRKNPNVGAAMLQPGRKTSTAGESSATEAGVLLLPMVLTLDQLAPNPDNPRITRNPLYDDIKASIRASGLDSVPIVTRNPDNPDKYIFSNGGNTRYQILKELWQETGDERFWRIHTLVKPWPGRLKCLVGHLAENEVRGNLTFIEKALGVHHARTIYENEIGRSVSLRELSGLLAQEGLPVHYSSINRMEDTVRYLYPWMKELLESGLGAPQIRLLLSLRQEAERIWEQFVLLSDSSDACFTDVFGACCRKFDSPELWSPDMFRDELIGDLLQALPHPELNYDRWMIELDPKRHWQPDEKPPLPETLAISDGSVATDGDGGEQQSESEPPEQQEPPTGFSEPPSDPGNTVPPRTEIQPDMYGGASVISGGSEDITEPYSDDNTGDSDEALMSMLAPERESDDDGDDDVSTLSPIDDDAIWPIPAYQDDIEHLQNIVFLLAWELAEKLGCEDEILPDRDSDTSPGFRAVGDHCSAPAALLLSLAGLCPPRTSPCGLDAVLTGGPSQQDVPTLDDEHAMKLLRLMRVLRRLRELQREVTFTEEDNNDE
ncbi:ParB family protein [Mixta tenebrionis]|jgi:ParB family protein of integrating conjugative element (PFGI_1 class)|uniref:ParB/Sulfiredoxin domain-containing protein n=2 Tax=Mixta TaxID=2100764 RepID=A0A6P1Q2K6_9GAMM|nr:MULTISPECIES: ParB family protein [Mixta]QHM72661.1 hypothetical protein C7M51_02979 [Mixta intestinalis]TPW40878.1 chromosome partitioning protein ParB [Mixta tenebrionis]